MSNIKLSAEVLVLAEELARRGERTVEEVIHQALLDARDLQDDIELCEGRKLRRLQDLERT